MRYDTSEFDHIGGWVGILTRVIGGQSLDAHEAQIAMREVLHGSAKPAQLAGFLCALRAKGETPDELRGFVDALYDAAVPIHFDDELRFRAIDTCGTGGDMAGTINVSTAAAFVVACAGVPVCKHGNRAASSLSGTADVLDELGVVVDHGADGVVELLRRLGITFCLAPRFHPAFRHATVVRKELGIPTAFNFLGPLANPSRLQRQVIGVSNARYAPIVAGVLEARGAIRAMTVYGNDGLDELTISGPSTIYELRDGVTRKYEITPEEFDIAISPRETLRGGHPKFNAERTRAILGGEFSPQSECVALNAAAGLLVGGVVDAMNDGVIRAREILASGRALRLLDDLAVASQGIERIES